MKIINIKKEKNTLNELERLHAKKYFYNEIRIDNVHLLLLNRFAKRKIFSKDSIYVAPSTLWASMESSGRDESHNFHNLPPRVIFASFCAIKKPDAIYKNKKFTNRFIIVTPIKYKNKERIILIVETGARLVNNINANINKLVTIYPKDKISLANNELLYQK